MGVDALDVASLAHAFDLLVYCFMPDHVHVLVEGINDNSNFRIFVSSFRRRSAHRYRQKYGVELWQRGYWERVLRNDDATKSAVLYIAANPVRAGLVAEPLQYQYTGSGVLDLGVLLLDIDKDDGWRG